MIRRSVRVTAVVFVSVLAAPSTGRAQTFKVDKFDIKGDGGTDYVAVESATGRVFVSRGTHMMVVEGATGKVLGDIPNTPGVHGAGIATKAGYGFTTNGGDKTVTMFDAKTLAELKRITVEQGGLDGILYDEPDDLIILTNHSRPIGTLTALNPKTGDIVGNVELEDNAPEGAAADGKGHIFVNNETKNTIQVIDIKTWKAVASWPLDPCKGPTGIAYDKASDRIFSGCSNTSVVVDPNASKVVATIKNGTRVDALGWDPSKKLIYIPNGGEGNVTVVHQDSPDKYTVVDTVATFAGAKTICVDPKTHDVPTGAWSGSTSSGQRGSISGEGRRARAWSAGTDYCRVVHRDQAVATGRGLLGGTGADEKPYPMNEARRFGRSGSGNRDGAAGVGADRPVQQRPLQRTVEC